MDAAPERLTDIAQQAFHDTLCPNPHPHNRIACSFVGGPILNGVDAAVVSVLADLRRQVEALESPISTSGSEEYHLIWQDHVLGLLDVGGSNG